MRKLTGEKLEDRALVAGMLSVIDEFCPESILGDVTEDAFAAFRLTADVESVEVGDTVEIDVWAFDTRPMPPDADPVQSPTVDPMFAAGVDILMATPQFQVLDVEPADFWVGDNAEVFDDSSGATISGIDPSGQLPGEEMQHLGTVTIEAVEPGFGAIVTAPDDDSLTMNLVFGHNEELTDEQVDYGALAIVVEAPYSATNGTDVDWSGGTDVFDALIMVEYAELNGLHEIEPDTEYPIAPDVDGDDAFTPLDVMLVVDAVYQQSLA